MNPVEIIATVVVYAIVGVLWWRAERAQREAIILVKRVDADFDALLERIKRSPK